MHLRRSGLEQCVVWHKFFSRQQFSWLIVMSKPSAILYVVSRVDALWSVLSPLTSITGFTPTTSLYEEVRVATARSRALAGTMRLSWTGSEGTPAAMRVSMV